MDQKFCTQDLRKYKLTLLKSPQCLTGEQTHRLPQWILNSYSPLLVEIHSTAPRSCLEISRLLYIPLSLE
jgi:hypothetical protein